MIILDNGSIHRSKKVQRFVKNNDWVELHFLPPYAPNLNLIERYWKFFKKKVLYGTYYETFDIQNS